MSENMVCLHIQLMGSAAISGGEIPLVLNQLKSRGLLYYLAATGESHSRDHLATLLWGDSSQSEAYHSLRSSLYHLRKSLRSVNAEEALISDGGSIGLSLAWYECDATEFDRLLKQGSEASLSQAVALYKGPFLQGFSLSDAHMFEDWVQMENTRLTHACSEALSRLTTFAEEREAWEIAIGYVNRMIRIDPLSEAAQQRLMRLYLGQGEVGLALRQYRQFENRLKQELGIAPNFETRVLYEDALRQQGGITIIPASHHTSKLTPNVLPFVGRDDLIHELSSISADIEAGRGATVLIQGEGGIGKSRLIHEFASRLITKSQPWMILQGSCSPFDDLLSHGPFIEALQNGSLDDLNDLLAESNASVPDARGRFFWRVLQTIRSMSNNSPLLLFIDDLQWANSSTLNLFGFLSMRLHHLPVMLVGTVQHAEAIPALQRLITLGRRRHELRLLSLTPLTQVAIADLLRASNVNPGSIETLAEWLNAKSAGNPFLLSEILAQLRTEIILKATSDGWQLDTTQWLRWRTTFSLPETAHDLVGWRLANISQEARSLLDVLAVASQPMPESVLRNIPGVWSNLFPALVDDLSARGLIMELTGNSFLMLPHHLLRETLLHRLSNLRRRTLHRQLAEAMEAKAYSDPNVWLRQIAMHAVAGEDVNRAHHYGMLLLPDLPYEYTGAETIDFVQHLHDLLAPTASPNEMILITRALGLLHQSLGHLETAGQWHRQTLEWAQKTNDYAAQAEAYFEMSELALMSIDYRTARQTAEKGLEVIRATRGAVLLVPNGKGHRLLGASLAMEGRDLAGAEEHLQKAVEIHRQIENQGDLCAVLFELGNVAAQRGELQRALDFYSESAHVAEAGRIHYYLALARNNFAYHSLLLGRVDEAEQSVSQGIKMAEAYDLLAALLHLYSTKGEIQLHLNKWNEAEVSFHSGLALAEELGSLERQAGYRGGLALAARGKKDFDMAQHLLEEALALIAEQGYWHLRTRLQLWLAETLFEQADYDEATKLLDEAMQIARSQRRSLLVEQGEQLHARLLAIREK
ncbi:MAG TPA: AAA family ATPase [Anaerolineales bacterium]|nr:AAA family ATPase [Anaerolineales bacterium]